MKDFFFSLKASYFFFGLLAVLFGVGNLLTEVDAFYKIFKQMTSTHLFYCWKEIASNPVIFIWLSAFILTGFCLLINTGCCAFSQTRALFQMNKLSIGSLQMTLLHIIALMVIILHAMDMTMVKRHKPVRLYEGQTIEMGNYRVGLKKIRYVADLSLITEDHKGKKIKATHLPASRFSRRDNYVQVEIKNQGQVHLMKNIRMLSPARVGSTYFFLDGFFIAHGDQKIGILIHHSKNPLVFAFFGVYLALLTLLGWRYLTMRV